ncbi:hypothetical protein GEMRC1_008660 [Eukaryota sp. GEM-RC1]
MLLINYVVKECLPLFAVESCPLYQLLQFYNSNAIVISRATATRRIRSNFLRIRDVVINSVKSNATAVSLTTDLWTSEASQPLIGITFHFITDQFVLKELLMDVKKLPHPHTAHGIQ